MRKFIGIRFSLVRFIIFSLTAVVALTSPSYRSSAAGSSQAPALVYKSTDAGLTWLPADTGMELFPAHKTQVLAIDPNEPSILYAGTNYGAFKSTDGASSWEPVNKGLPQRDVTGLAIDFLSPSTLYALSSNPELKNSGFVSQSNDSAVKWNGIGPSAFNFNTSIVIDPSNASTLYVGGDGVGQNADLCGVYKSTDGGSSWTFARLGTYQDTVEHLVVSPEDLSVLYASVKGIDEDLYDGGLYKSVDGGMTWNQINYDSGWVAVDPQSASTIYLASDDGDGLMKSVDAGETWSNVSLSFDPTVISIDSSSDIYAAGSGATGNGLLAKSTDGGSTWEFLSLQAPVLCFAFDQSNPSTVYAGSQIPPPLITGVQIDGKALVVTGQGFHAGAVIDLSTNTTSETLKTTFDAGSQLTAPKGSKLIAPGETVSISVTEADRTQSVAFQFTRPN